jgi:hypothetical protein
MSMTWTREPIAPEEGVGMVYSRNGYRVQRLGRHHGWTVWRGGDFLGPVQRLVEGKALTWRHEIEQAHTLANYEDRARGLSDWNLRQAYSGALMRNRGDEAAIYRAELDRRKALEAERKEAFEVAQERARTQYTMHAFRPPFSDGKALFNHIMGPGTGRSLCGSLHGGPGEALDLGKIDCEGCMIQYARLVLGVKL